ncbi:VOC family protein [Methylobacterium sp. PvR107]|uniref:VOC family protein n=1 Tax=Methylobacterium sp. PvR107 TaxID=2806597 RepID=UPI001AE18210|nr:VOC family protein [Methylobacterium sp. PvR107]MBP1178581.1 lactoylglutathione lyase [Methylobacterium sp. PvR107]
MRFAHVALWTPDLDAASAFWRTYFGAEIGAPYHSRRRDGFVSRFVTLPDTDTHIELMTGPWIQPAPSREQVGWAHVAVSVGCIAAVDALATRCAADGCLLSPPRRTGDGFYEAVIAMPDGTPVEITI